MATVRYQALGPLLAGEGSRAFLGLEIADGQSARPVVLVWVPAEVAANPELMEQVRRETAHAGSLEHPNIVRVLGFATLEEGPARVVEFADGESLRRVLEVTQRLPAGIAAQVVADAAMGVHYAHLAGNDDGSPLVHGDLRPETLLVSFHGVCKVTGYGALLVAPTEPYGKRVLGRRLYCAPEQVMGGRDAINRQTDVYLLGLTLYECLTGNIPFENEEQFDQAVLNRPLPPIELDDVPVTLREVVVRATAKKGPDRYPSALALRQALEDAVGGGLPGAAAVEQYLGSFFPPQEPTRVARQREVDAGIAAFARQQWSQAAPAAAAPSPAPPPPSAPAPAAAVAPRPRPAPLPAPDDEDDEPSQTYRPPPKRRTGWVVAGAVALAGGVAWVRSSGTSEPPPPEPALAAAADSAPDASVEVDAGALVDALPPPPDAGVPSSLAAQAAPPAEATGTLELYVEPSVEVMLGDALLGRTPFTGSLPAGRHVVRLVDKAKGISTSRAFTVKAGESKREEVYLAKGFVQVTAPPGAAIFVDGRKMGVAPLAELSLYEGGHQLLVRVGEAKWKENFVLRPNDRVYFNVEATQE